MIFDISLLSFALKMGAKKVSKGTLKNFLKIKIKLSKIAIKSHARRQKKTLLRLQSSLEETWGQEKTIPISNQSIDEQLSSTKNKREGALKPKKHLSRNTLARSHYSHPTRNFFFQPFQNSFNPFKNPLNSRLVRSSHLDRTNQGLSSELISHFLVDVAKQLQLLEEELFQLPSLDIARHSLETACTLSPNSVEPYLGLAEKVRQTEGWRTIQC